MTATTWRRATSGFTSRPVSGAGTRLGVGSGVGLGGAVGLGATVGEGDALGVGEAVGSGVGEGDGEGEVDAIATGCGLSSGLIIPPAATPMASPAPSVSATTSPARALFMLAGPLGRARDGPRSTPIVQVWVDDHRDGHPPPDPVRAEDTAVRETPSIGRLT
jgi:hypothetical protein